MPRGSLNCDPRINGLCGAIQMSRVVSFRFWRINIISNIFRTFHIVLEENYIAITIVIELSPSPMLRCVCGKGSYTGPLKSLGSFSILLKEVSYTHLGCVIAVKAVIL